MIFPERDSHSSLFFSEFFVSYRKIFPETAMSSLPNAGMNGNPKDLMSPQTSADWLSLARKTNWCAPEKLQNTNSQRPRGDSDESQRQGLPAEFDLPNITIDDIINYCRRRESRTKLSIEVGTHLITHRIDSQRVTAVIARTFLYLASYLRKQNKQKSRRSLDGLQCFLGTLLEAMQTLNVYEVLKDYDVCHLLPVEEDKPHFAAWMRSARSAAQQGGNIDAFVEKVGKSFAAGFGVVARV